MRKQIYLSMMVSGMFISLFPSYFLCGNGAAICNHWSNQHWDSIGSDDVLASNRRQAIIWDEAVNYSDVIMSGMTCQITGVSIVHSTVCTGADQRKHQSLASLAFFREFTGDPWIPHTKDQWRGICFHLMTSSWWFGLLTLCCTYMSPSLHLGELSGQNR